MTTPALLMQPLVVRARLRNGYVARDPWSPSLDGIIAAAVMRERIGMDAMVVNGARAVDMTPVEGLPLEVVRDGEHWWYAASSPAAVGIVGRERRHFHRRFDDQLERHLVGDIKRVQTSAGPYKNARLFDTRVICRGLEWHAIGDGAEMRRLLSGVAQIGARRGVGYGEVTEWIVIDGGDSEQARFRRPLPEAFACRIGVDGPVVPWGLVPPARVGLVDCIMPDGIHAR